MWFMVNETWARRYHFDLWIGETEGQSHGWQAMPTELTSSWKLWYFKSRSASLAGDICCHTPLPTELSTAHKHHQNDWKLVPSVPWTVSKVSFSVANFNLYPFAVMNYMNVMAFLSSVNSSRELLNLKVDLGAPELYLLPPSHCLTTQAIFRTLTFFYRNRNSSERQKWDVCTQAHLQMKQSVFLHNSTKSVANEFPEGFINLWI